MARSRTNGTLESLTLFDYSDRELLWVVFENADDDGWTLNREIAKAIGLSEDNSRANQCVGIRMAWLKRYGVAEYKGEGSGKWRVTPIGEVLMKGELAKDEQRALNSLRPEQMILVSRWMGERYQKSKVEAGHMIRREIRRGLALR